MFIFDSSNLQNYAIQEILIFYQKAMLGIESGLSFSRLSSRSYYELLPENAEVVTVRVTSLEELRTSFERIKSEFLKEAPDSLARVHAAGEPIHAPSYRLELFERYETDEEDEDVANHWIRRALSLISDKANHSFSGGEVLDLVSLVDYNSIFRAFFSELSIDQADCHTVGDAEVIKLSKNPRLKLLEIGHSMVGTAGVRALARNSRLQVLRLHENFENIAHEAIEDLSNNLSLRENNITARDDSMDNESAVILSQNPRILHLKLSGCEVDSGGAASFEGNECLISLNLSGNPINDEGAIALARNTRLLYLNLSDSQIGDQGAQALAGNNTLKILDLTDNRLTRVGAIALGGNTTLEFLNVAGNRIDSIGLIALANNSSLRKLDIRSIRTINDDVIEAFARNVTLESLDFSADFTANYDLISSWARTLNRNTTLTNIVRSSTFDHVLERRLKSIFNPITERNKIFKTITQKILDNYSDVESAFAGAGSSAVIDDPLSSEERKYLTSISDEDAVMLLFNIETRFKQALGDTPIDYGAMIEAIKSNEFGEILLSKAAFEINVGIGTTISVPSRPLQDLLKTRYPLLRVFSDAEFVSDEAQHEVGGGSSVGGGASAAFGGAGGSLLHTTTTDDWWADFVVTKEYKEEEEGQQHESGGGSSAPSGGAGGPLLHPTAQVLTKKRRRDYEG